MNLKRKSTWYSIFLPLPLSDAAKILIPALLIGASAAIIMRDLVPVAIAAIIGYIGLIFLSGAIGLYELRLTSDDDVEYLTAMLDRTPSLERQGDELLWKRRTLSLFRSKLDDIKISRLECGWAMEGRRFNLMSAATALKQRRRSLELP